MKDKITCIVIDDNKDIVDAFSEFLTLKGVKVVAKGYNGLDAVELYKKFKPDVVFLDHRMPEYDGLFALYNIRQINENAYVIMVSADHELHLNPNIMKLKPTKIFTKPFQIDDIITTLESLSFSTNSSG